jgi:hypothetical protein
MGAFGSKDTWGYPGRLVALGDTLFVYDLFGPPAVTMLDRASGAVIGAFGRPGSGPGEFRDMTDVFRAEPGGSRFWMYDQGARRLSLYGHGDSGELTLLRTRPVSAPGWPEYVRPLMDGLVMGGIFPGGSPVLLTDSMGGAVRDRLGRYPAHLPHDPARTDLRINRVQVTVRPDGSQLALAYMHFNLLQIYDFRSRTVRAIIGPEAFTEPRPEDLADLNPHRFAYVIVRSTQDLIYALFCACDISQPRPAGEGMRLHVFTWTGRAVAVLPIDPRSTEFVFEVSPDDQFIYTTTADPYPQVLVARLPAELARMDLP